jgi:L-rhamnose mutarotase
MQRACFLLRVKPDRLEEYKRHHKSVDAEMLQALSEVGIRNYSLFLRDDGLLVGYFESENPRESLRLVSETEANARWQDKMNPFFESGSGDMNKGSLGWLDAVFWHR